MMINGSTSYTSYGYARVNTGNANNNSQSTEQMDGVKGRGHKPPPRNGGPNGQGGPEGAGGPGGRPPKGPRVDTNQDDLWSKDEIETMKSEFNVDFDVDELMETYDANQDGSIDGSEREGIRENNAFNMPPPQEMMQRMMGGKGNAMRQNIVDISAASNTTDDENTDLENFKLETESMLLELINKYKAEDSNDMATNLMEELAEKFELNV